MGRARYYPRHIAPSPPILVNRAPVLTVWATVVAERPGYPPDTALNLGRYVAGSGARAQARRLGIVEETEETAEHREKAREARVGLQKVRLLGREIPVVPAADGTLRAAEGGKPASSRSVAGHVARAFGDRLAEVGPAMEELAASLPREELNRVGIWLYETFRFSVPEGVNGVGSEGRATARSGSGRRDGIYNRHGRS